MTDVQLYLAVGLPILAVLTSLTISLLQISSIRDEIRGLREDTRSQVVNVREENKETMREIRSDVREIRSDIKLLTGKVYELMARNDHA